MCQTAFAHRTLVSSEATMGRAPKCTTVKSGLIRAPVEVWCALKRKSFYYRVTVRGGARQKIEFVGIQVPSHVTYD